MTPPTREEIEAILKKDPFIQHWKENYENNLKEGIFNMPNVRPLNYLKNIETNKQVPFVLLAAGPSLDKNIQLIKENQNKCMIVCADVTLFKVLENGIKPDFVVTIDPNPEIVSCWSDLQGNLLDVTGINLLAPTSTNTETLKKWKGNIFLFNQSDHPLSPKGKALKSITKSTEGYGEIYNQFFVGATMFQFSSIFSPEVIILTGYDFAYTDNKAYCDGVVEHKSAYMINYEQDKIAEHTEKLRSLYLSAIELYFPMGNDKIPTTGLFESYKKVFVALVKKYQITTINSTEGGILTELMRMTLNNSFQKFCLKEINKVDLSKPKFKKRGKRR